MQKTYAAGSFPATGQPIVVPDGFDAVIAVLYRDEGGTTHDVQNLRAEGDEVYGDWPDNAHREPNVRVLYREKSNPPAPARRVSPQKKVSLD